MLDIGGNDRLSYLRRALTSRGRFVIVGGETDGRWLGGVDGQLRAHLLSLFVGFTPRNRELFGSPRRILDGPTTAYVGQAKARLRARSVSSR